VLSVATIGGFVRLLPWFLARNVPAGIALPFAGLLAARALEVSVLVGVPTGVGIATALFVERGEARALAALGATPLRIAVAVVPLGLAVLVATMSMGSATASESPGRVVARMVNAGRAACAGQRAPRRIDVPLLSTSWLCFPSGPRLAGGVPGFHSGLWFTASAVEPATAEPAVVIDDVRIAGVVSSLRLSVHAARVRVSGLSGGGPSRRLGGTRRGFLVGLAALVTALASAWAILRGGLAHPIWAAAGAGAAALAAMAVIRVLDDRQSGITAYAWVLLLGAASALLLHAVAARVLRGRIAGRKA
jgi:hypothetical protein